MFFLKKKIAIFNFPLLDVGGITTWAINISKGFNKLGFSVDHFYCTPTGRFSCEENYFVPIGDKYQRGEKIPSQSIGYEGLDETWYHDFLDNYDFVIFAHPSPHPTKGNLERSGIKDWQLLYKYCHIPNVVIFHDMKWHLTNEWLVDVKEYIDVILAAQHNFIDSVEFYAKQASKKIVTDWLFFPIDTNGCSIDFKNQRDHLTMLSQWIKWKNHHLLLQEANDVKIPIYFYNGGMEYHKLCKTDIWNNIRVDWVEDSYVNKEAKHEYFGFVHYNKVRQIYRESLGNIDLTTRTYQNYTHHECSLFGCVLLCTEECRQGPYNHIHDGEYWPIDINNIANSINKFVDVSEDEKANIRLKAFNRTKHDFECSQIANKINQIIFSIEK